MPVLLPGTGGYTLTVTPGGFRTKSRAVNVLLGPPVSVNITVQVAKATSSVSVTAEAPLIQAENGDPRQWTNSRFPKSRIREMISRTSCRLPPGVVVNTDVQGDANFSILGMPDLYA